MNKIIIGIGLVFFTFLSNAQETLIVKGLLYGPTEKISNNLKKQIFCHFKGDFIVSDANHFSPFRVDSVISGSFQGINNKKRIPPFKIEICLINECTILDPGLRYTSYPGKNYTLRIKRFPHTNYYYVDSLCQVYSDTVFIDYLSDYYECYQGNIDVLTKETLQKRHDLIEKTQGYKVYSYNQKEKKQSKKEPPKKFLNLFKKKKNSTVATPPTFTKYKDYRYISYILPFMTNKDSINTYWLLDWDGFDKRGRMVGGTDSILKKKLYSDFLYKYLDDLIPFTLPPKATDSIGWHKWYDSIISASNCFPQIDYATGKYKYITGATWIPYFIPDTLNNIYFRNQSNYYIINKKKDVLTKRAYPKNCQLLSDNSNFSIQDGEIPEYNSFDKRIDFFKLTNGVFCKKEQQSIPLNLLQRMYIPSHLIIHSNKNFLIFSSQNPNGYNCLKAGEINRKGEWVIEPKNLYKKQIKTYIGDIDNLNTLSFCQSSKNEIIIAFSDKSYGRKTYSAREKYYNALILYKIDKNLEKKDSAFFTIDFPHFDYHFYQIYILKKDETYFLLAEVSHNRGHQLYYKLLNKELTPKSDFIKLSNDYNYGLVGKPIITSGGFMLSWVDNDLSEDLLRSVLIDKSGKQSKIINITNYKINGIYNVEFDENNVDIYIFNKENKSLIRKRVNKKEYSFIN